MRYDDVILIDELKICYVASNDGLSHLEAVEVGEYADMFGYRLYRMVNDRFRCFYDVVQDGNPVAQLKFGHYTDRDDATTYVYYKVLNPILYDAAKLRKALELPTKMGMVFNNYTAIDLAYDSPQNLPTLIKKMMRDKDVTTIINGKAVRDRKSVLDGVLFMYSSTLNRLNNPTITIKQKKAANNKNDGITVQAYNKKAEILQSSKKQYILDYHGNPKRLYRLEVRLHNQELKDYFAAKHIIPTTDILYDGEMLKELFFHHLGAVIRFTRGRTKIQWKELLGCNGRG